MKTRSNKGYDFEETQNQSTKSTPDKKRRPEHNLLEVRDPDYKPYYKLRSTNRNRARGTSATTTFQPTIINIKKFSKRRPSRPKWNYSELLAAQAATHRVAFREAGVDHAPGPTWSYLKVLKAKADLRAAHRAAFKKAGVDWPPAPTWSYRRYTASERASRVALWGPFEEYGVGRVRATWSYRRYYAARKASITAFEAAFEEPFYIPSPVERYRNALWAAHTRVNKRYTALKLSRHRSSSESSGYASLQENVKDFNSFEL